MNSPRVFIHAYLKSMIGCGGKIPPMPARASYIHTCMNMYVHLHGPWRVFNHQSSSLFADHDGRKKMNHGQSGCTQKTCSAAAASRAAQPHGFHETSCCLPAHSRELGGRTTRAPQANFSPMSSPQTALLSRQQQNSHGAHRCSCVVRLAHACGCENNLLHLCQISSRLGCRPALVSGDAGGDSRSTSLQEASHLEPASAPINTAQKYVTAACDGEWCPCWPYAVVPRRSAGSAR